MIPGIRNDGLRLQYTSINVVSLRCAGTLAGVVVLGAAARNGPGAGTISATAGGLTWQAPNSALAGAVCPIPTSAAYLLEDGADPSCWVRVQVDVDYLPASGGAQVFLGDVYDNAVGQDDVAAANAAAGSVSTLNLTLLNVSGNAIRNALLWLDPTASGISELTVSSDDTNYYQPTSSSDPHVLAWSTIAVGASVNLWLRRTTPSAAAFNPTILNMLQWEWEGA
jgi:hypothetical protein